MEKNKKKQARKQMNSLYRPLQRWRRKARVGNIATPGFYTAATFHRTMTKHLDDCSFFLSQVPPAWHQMFVQHLLTATTITSTASPRSSTSFLTQNPRIRATMSVSVLSQQHLFLYRKFTYWLHGIK